MPSTPILEVKNIRNAFGPQVVHEDLNLQVQKGEVIGLVGGSGSGKSVLLRTMTGLRQPTSGTALINGRPVSQLKAEERAATLGVLFQQGALFSGLTVLENITAPLREFTKNSREKCNAIAREKLHLVGLPPEAAQKMPSELSGGMVKRVALARAMAMDPAILFLDEPTAGLDPIAAAAFDDLVRQLNQDHNLTFVIITHDLDTLYTICTRIAVLVDKRITSGTLAELLKNRHPWIKEYFHGARSRAAQHKENR